MTDKKKHHTQHPVEVLKRALNKQGYLHAAALSHVTGKSIDTCVRILSKEIPIQNNGLPKIAQALGIDPKDLRE